MAGSISTSMLFESCSGHLLELSSIIMLQIGNTNLENSPKIAQTRLQDYTHFLGSVFITAEFAVLFCGWLLEVLPVPVLPGALELLLPLPLPLPDLLCLNALVDCMTEV